MKASLSNLTRNRGCVRPLTHLHAQEDLRKSAEIQISNQIYLTTDF